MNLVPEFNKCLLQQNAQPLHPYVFRIEDIDLFLKEAYQINRRIAELSSYLRSIRQSYLSITQPPKRKQIQRTNSSTLSSPHGLERKYLTDRQRSDIDTETKQLIRELNAGIKGLLDVEQHRQQTEASVALRKRARRGLGALGRWAAGGAITAKSPQEELEEAKANTLKVHRESVVWYLGSHLEECSRYQASMMEIRLQREVEKNKSVLYKTHTTAFSAGSHPEMNGAMSASLTSKNKEPHWNSQKPSVDELERDGQQSTTSSGQQLSPEQLQLFAEENQDMLKQYEDSLDQVRTAEKSLLEISELQTTLASNLAMQSAHIDQLVQDTELTTDNIGSGNKELKRATERRSTAQMVFYGTSAFCLTLVLWDLFI